MTKEHGKRKIEIDDKRRREDASAAAPAVDEALLRQFTPQGIADAAESVPAAAAAGCADLSSKAAEYLELAQRKEAELRNYRKRVQQDLADARRFAVEGLLADLFPALDGLAQAVHTYKAKPDGADPLLDGLRRTVRALEGALLKHGVEKINQAGVPFDPQLHHALSVEDSADVTEDTVAELYVEGYKMGEMVLKPAMVRVLKPA